MKAQQGFTLIELLTVILIIGILAHLSINTFYEYRKSAYYSAVQRMIHDARGAAAASQSNVQSLPPAIPFSSFKTPGTLPEPVYSYLPGIQLARKTSITAKYDPDCIEASCISEFIQANHCDGDRYSSWTRFGDGSEILLENIDGKGCP